MSAWPIPDEVVDDFVYFADMHPCDECGGEYPCRHHREEVRERLERHRLVVLPEGAELRDVWEIEGNVEVNGEPGTLWFGDEGSQQSAAQKLRWIAFASGRVRPVETIRIPGQPITVDKEERDGDE